LPGFGQFTTSSVQRFTNSPTQNWLRLRPLQRFNALPPSHVKEQNHQLSTISGYYPIPTAAGHVAGQHDGARPSSGAAASKWPNRSKSLKTAGRKSVAAAEDVRTPYFENTSWNTITTLLFQRWETGNTIQQSLEGQPSLCPSRKVWQINHAKMTGLLIGKNLSWLEN
jgi:hypothetical protein